MLWLALRSLTGRRLSTAVTAFGLLVATLGFTLLASTSQTASAVLSGDISTTWQAPYDLLVRPSRSVTAMEATQGLVRPNYVTALGAGGITEDQLAAIRRLPSVAIAAPIAISGYAFWDLQGFGLSLPRPSPGARTEVYRMSFGETADAGLSGYAIQTHYLVVASNGWFKVDPGTLRGELTTSDLRMSCASTAVTGDEISCWAPNECFGDSCGPAEDPPGYGLEMLQPVLVAGIDPEAEAALTGLRSCLVGGRYLSASDSPVLAPERDPPGTVIPALISDRSFVDATLSARLDRAADPNSIFRGLDPGRAAGWIPTSQVDRTVDTLYRQHLAQVGEEVDEWPMWSTSDVAYTAAPGGGVAATASAPDQAVLQRANFHLFGEGDRLARPPELQDRWFRQVQQRSYAGVSGNRYWNGVGTYDPTCLPGFNDLAGGAGLEAYAVPKAQLAQGQFLFPNRSMAGYLNTPPVILTNMDSAAWLADSKRFAGGPGKAFISAVRVRVSGLGSISASSERKLARVAAEIQEVTGLAVDVVKGSSTKAVAVSLPAGDFGRPAIEVSEGWSVKGVAVRFMNAVSLQSIALFALALLAAAMLVATTAYIAARRRHSEFGVLRALGWPTWRIGSLIVAEVAIVAGGVGLVAMVASAVLAFTTVIAVATPALFLTAPLALGVGLIAAMPAAVMTARSTAVSRLIRPTRGARSRPPGSVAWLGVTDMTRNWRIEAFAAATIIGLGATVLGALVLVVVAFRGELDVTVLGADLAGRVRPFHFVLAVLTTLIASLGAAQIVSLSYLERRPQLAVLRALGWSRGHVGTMIVAQAAGIGLLAAGMTASGIAVLAAATGAGAFAAGAAIVVGLLTVAVCSGIAAVVPVFQAYSATVIRTLREE